MISITFPKVKRGKLSDPIEYFTAESAEGNNKKKGSGNF
jgi:hypothetical protein